MNDLMRAGKDLDELDPFTAIAGICNILQVDGILPGLTKEKLRDLSFYLYNNWDDHTALFHHASNRHELVVNLHSRGGNFSYSRRSKLYFLR